MITVALTGSLGAGKSAVGDLFASWGAERVDADRLAREAVEPGTEGLARIEDLFGDRVVTADGALDRSALRRIVFGDSEALSRLESIVHPIVDRLRAERRERARGRGVEVFVLEIPLLFEKGREGEFDVVVAVDAPTAIRRQRIIEGRGLTAAEFESMEGAQLPSGLKRRRADRVVWNPGSRAALESDARRVWDSIRALTRRPADGLDRSVSGPDGAGSRLLEIDLHMHTSASKDSLSAPDAVVEQARRADLDRIAITDHDQIRGAFEARDLAPDLVIVGEEVRTSEGLDLIGLYLTDHILPGSAFRATADAIREQGGVVYLPHPFDSHRGTDEEFLASVEDCVDAVEGINARIHDPARNERAVHWASERDLPIGAGSDAHLLGEIGRARAIVRPFDGPGELLAALAEGRIEGRPSSHLVHVGSTWAKLWKRVTGHD